MRPGKLTRRLGPLTSTGNQYLPITLIGCFPYDIEHLRGKKTDAALNRGPRRPDKPLDSRLQPHMFLAGGVVGLRSA
jgi:hypothetical protein